MSNASAFAALDEHIARVRELPGFIDASMPDVADALEREQRRFIAAGTSPDGKRWEPKKDGSGKPLATAGDSLRVAPVGHTVFMRLTDHVARHHLGRAKGGTVRQILPTDGLPDPFARAITNVLTKHFARAVGHG